MGFMSDNKERIAIAVLTCDPYSDIWDAYGELFQRFWPDCPYDLYMASHQESFYKFGFKPILLGEDVSWSHGLLVLLDKLEEMGYKYTMLPFDDLMLSEKVDNGFVTSSIEGFISEGGDCLRFVPEKASHCYKHNDLYGRMGIKVPYRVTLGFAVWKIDVLKQIAVEGESAWQFEKNATERSFNFKKFYCTWRSPFKFINLVNKRKIDIKEYEKLKALIPDATFDREQVIVKEEKVKSIFLRMFLKYCPIKLQYPIYKFFTKPINI